VEAAPELILPSRETELCQEMSPRTGELLMKALWNSPLVTFYEAYTGGTPPSPTEDDILTDFFAPPINVMVWPVSPRPGFICGCDNTTMDECLGHDWSRICDISI
jgi:hypothetical protein